jgi:3-deoxy-D-manno-octulosonic-acid transferase
MSKFIWQNIYTFLILPLIFILAHIAALFSKQIREGLFPRRETIAELENWIKSKKRNDRYVLFHAASMGEFEHIKPLLYKLKQKHNTINVLTFFSPSGYKHVKDTPGLDFFLYMPFDFSSHWKKLYELLKPSLLVISKHDVWPMQIWQAHTMNIPIYLVNASLPEKSSRTRPFIKSFLKHVYRDFSNIFTISKEDAQRFSIHYPRCSVQVMGDTKYDQVMFRKNESLNKDLLPSEWYKNKWILLAGSIWPDDEKKLIPGFINLLENYKNVRLILAPHEPIEKFVNTIEERLSKWGVIKFTQLKKNISARIIIVNTIGQLADLYQYANAAYVGGSFKQGVHNVMEPAIYGIPVVFGPVHQNIYEAIQLVKSEGGIVIENEIQANEILNKLVANDSYRKATGKKALAMAQENTGATDKIINHWESVFLI